MESKKRVTFYIDGFNFYFGLKRTKKADAAWRNFYWIDIVKPNYGEFWVGNGPIENGRKKEILVGHERGSYGTNGAVTGWLNGNAGYNYTNSRRNCATVEKSYICFYMYPKGETMTVYYTCRGEYLKNGTPMFYQESNKVNGINYTKW